MIPYQLVIRLVKSLLHTTAGTIRHADHTKHIGAWNSDLLVLQRADERTVRHLEKVDVVGVVFLSLCPEIDDLDVADPALRAVARSSYLERQLE